MNKTVVEAILEHKIITICRRIYGEQLLSLVQALCDGGIKLVEVTFDQVDKDHIKKTTEAISMLNKNFGDKMLIGAGTVLSKEQVLAAYEAGAKYIISPNTDKEVITYTKELGLTSIPAGMSPTEILLAHKYGGDIIKVFPAGFLGLTYIKDIRGPISHINLLSAGGVTEDNISEYIKAGYNGFGISGRLADREVIAAGDFAEITRRAKAYIKNSR